MNLILRNELVDDPLSRGYSGMSDDQAAADLDAVYRTRTRTYMDSAEIYEKTDSTEFQAKTDPQKVYIRDIWTLGENVDVRSGSKARNVYITIFGAGSATVQALAAALNVPISRAEELGLSVVLAGEVGEARK